MSRFKVGDRVMLTGTIREIDENADDCYTVVKFDGVLGAHTHWMGRDAMSRARQAGEAMSDVDANEWRQVGDGAFAPPFGTIRVCRSCGCLVVGGPTVCGRCADQKDLAPTTDGDVVAPREYFCRHVDRIAADIARDMLANRDADTPRERDELAADAVDIAVRITQAVRKAVP